MNFAELKTDLVADLEPVRPARGPAVAAFLTTAFNSALLLGLVAALLGLRSDLKEVTVSSVFPLIALILLATVASAAYLAFALSLPGRKVGSLATLAPAFWVLAFNCLLWIDPIPVGKVMGDGLAPIGLKCSVCMTCLALIPAVVFLLWVRRLAVLHPEAVAKALGVAVGAIAAFALAFHCPDRHPLHTFVYHGGPLLILGYVVRLFGTRFLRW